MSRRDGGDSDDEDAEVLATEFLRFLLPRAPLSSVIDIAAEYFFE